MKLKKIDILLAALILIFIPLGVYSNVKQEQAVDNSKIPEKVEDERMFQRWITNLKNNDIEITADEFRLLEENEVYNTKWMKVYSIEEKGKKEEFEKTLQEHKDIRYVVFSPSEREFLDYRSETRMIIGPHGEYFRPNEVRFYGQKEDKIIDARILDCSLDANCHFDRAYFLDNDTFVITEFSRNIGEYEENVVACSRSEVCTYTIKLHLIDLINNKRWVYESKPMELNLNELIPEL